MKDEGECHDHNHDLGDHTQGDVGKGVDTTSADTLVMMDGIAHDWGNEGRMQGRRSHVNPGSQSTWPLDYWSVFDVARNSRGPGHSPAGRVINMWTGMWVWLQRDGRRNRNECE